MSEAFEPWFVLPGGPIAFPDPRLADEEGLVAFGGDLSVERLLLGYRNGIFPWFEEGVPPLWWSPDPRAILRPDGLHVSRSLRRTIRRGGFTLTFNRAFRRVMDECALDRPEGTWIIPAMLDAFVRLHERHRAHSLEVWCESELVAGIYGVQVGGLFAAESMFHRRTDMSKVALVALVRSLFAAGVRLFDVQFRTPHLARMGAEEIPRSDYLDRLARVIDLDVDVSDLVPTCAEA